MSSNNKVIDLLLRFVLSERVRKKSETLIISIAILSFLVHLVVISLVHLGLMGTGSDTHFNTNPIGALYTPFSFILLYEVYLLVFYLPKSTTVYIGKQYEIITLIMIRGMFMDLANLQFTKNWFSVNYDLKFTYDLVATLLLFFLIWYFYRLKDKHDEKHEQEPPEGIHKFMKIKNVIALLLIPVFLGLAIYGLFHWMAGSSYSISLMVDSLKDNNVIFFNEFFTVLILTDVLLLLVSFTHTSQFYKVIRNSGFVISTILIKLSFGTGGILNTILVVAAVLFGVLILQIHNLYLVSNK